MTSTVVVSPPNDNFSNCARSLHAPQQSTSVPPNSTLFPIRLSKTGLLPCTEHKTNLQSSLITPIYRRVGGLQTPPVVCVPFKLLYKCSQTRPLKAQPESNCRVCAMTQMFTSRADKAKGRHIPVNVHELLPMTVFADPDESLLRLLRKSQMVHCQQFM